MVTEVSELAKRSPKHKKFCTSMPRPAHSLATLETRHALTDCYNISDKLMTGNSGEIVGEVAITHQGITVAYAAGKDLN